MSETMKTLAFSGVAILAAGLALATRSPSVGTTPPERIGQTLFPEFTDPLAAKSLKIVRFDEDLANLSEIEVKQVNGIWTLPSHDGYPADAENRIRDAATQFVDLKILQMVTDDFGKHGLYGVLEPSADKSAVGDQGVGTLVNIKDEGGDNLVNLVIGKEVKDQEGQHFVRVVDQYPVYIAKIDPEQLPVKFDDWIEKDLLQVNAWDISQLQLKDYTFQVAQTLSGPVTDFDQRLDITLTDDNGTWKLDQLLEARGGQLQPTELLEGEELNTERLTALKNALDTLEIVDVERKPDGLGADLRADQGFFNDQAGVDSLVERGFYPVQIGAGDTIELLSTDGEALVRTKEGVEYILRFGRVASVDTESDDGKLNRFLLVSARVDQSQFPEPELEALPELPAGAESTPESESQEESSQSAVSRYKTLPTVLQAEAAEEAAEVEADAVDAEEEPVLPEALESAEEEPADESTEAAATETPAVEETSEPAAEAVESTEESAEDATETGAEASETDASAPESATEAESDDSATPVDLQAERERITKENQRKIDERNDKIKKAEEKVRELNYRFADWYYVISEDVYKKIHLSRSDIIKETEEAKEQGSGIDAFRSLQEQGPEGASENEDTTDLGDPVDFAP